METIYSDFAHRLLLRWPFILELYTSFPSMLCLLLKRSLRLVDSTKKKPTTKKKQNKKVNISLKSMSLVRIGEKVIVTTHTGS